MKDQCTNSWHDEVDTHTEIGPIGYVNEPFGFRISWWVIERRLSPEADDHKEPYGEIDGHSKPVEQPCERLVTPSGL